MRKMHAPRAPGHRRSQEGQPARVRRRSNPAAGTVRIALATCCLAWLALDSPALRADGLSQAPPEEACSLDLPPIHAVTIDVRPSEGEVPRGRAPSQVPLPAEMADGAAPCRGWPQVLYRWEATSYCHGPLYFEEVNLERYGYLGCDDRCRGVPAALVQPILSGAHFFGTVPLLPYKMTAEPCCECIYTLGHYRPGSPVPHQIHRVPFRPLAGGAEACAITGLIFAIP